MVRLVSGVGINDSTTKVQDFVYKNGKTIKTWTCPYYERWVSLLKRLFNEGHLKRRPKYRECTICDEWLVFSNFKSWREGQDWKGNHLDKDLLVLGNKHYSPETCIFISPLLNTLCTEAGCSIKKHDLKLGVSYHKRDKKYTSQCSDPFLKRLVHLGYCDSEEDAHRRWRDYKLKLSHQFLEKGLIPDRRIYDNLCKKYE